MNKEINMRLKLHKLCNLKGSKRIILFLCFLTAACSYNSKQPKFSPTPPTHTSWSQLLKKHVTTDGRLNYKGFVSDSAELNQYLNLLTNNPPNKSSWSEQEQLAYWINAYNAFTVKLIVDNYPVTSITDLHPTLYVPLLNTVWHIKFFSIGAKKFNLDEIEHTILRKQFNEPRIHFAIVCASYSCPALRAEAYTADNIAAQLEDQALRFINDPKRNMIGKGSIEISSIFKWFKDDFTKKRTLVEFLNQYSTIAIDKKARIRFMDYDWSLNE